MKAKVMVKVHDQHVIQGFLPEDVFEAGIRTKNIPRDLEHLIITPPKNQRKLRLDSTLAVVFSCKDSPLHRFQEDDIAIETVVTGFEPGEFVIIEGESDEVAATLRIELAKAARNSTKISHELEVNLLKGKLLKKALFEAAGPSLFQKDIELFRTMHLEKTLIDLEKPASVTPIRKPFVERATLKEAASGI